MYIFYSNAKFFVLNNIKYNTIFNDTDGQVGNDSLDAWVAPGVLKIGRWSDIKDSCSSAPSSKCFSKPDYSCCPFVYTDESGVWGVINDDWCVFLLNNLDFGNLYIKSNIVSAEYTKHCLRVVDSSSISSFAHWKFSCLKFEKF
ncbi:hypothetical protein H8356DRAFT_1417755 [Neocallimastix lanati (nom. inval.)]|nr:hypothetical protein H8356DRAFT_1417755 [Neocallimastix sp. JGI-2020a]